MQLTLDKLVQIRKNKYGEKEIYLKLYTCIAQNLFCRIVTMISKPKIYAVSVICW